MSNPTIKVLRSLCSYIFLFTAYALQAQYNFPSTTDSGYIAPETKSPANYRKAKKLLYKENYIGALPSLEKVIEKRKSQGKDVTQMWYQLAICNVVSKSPLIGLHILDSLEKTSTSLASDFYYWKALACHYNYKFDQAIVYYKKALNKSFVVGTEREKIKRKIQECENGLNMVPQFTNFEVLNAGAGLNTMFSEHSPTIANDSKTVFYTSRKNINGDKVTFTGEYFEDIYQTKLDSNLWEKPLNVKSLNTKEHDACSQISNDNTTMIMYRSTRNGDIYLSNLENQKWTNPKPIKNLRSMSYESSGFLTANGNRIYFTSNKFSDQADLDIYYMDKDATGEFSNPKSIGKNINTPYDEDGLFLTDDGSTLYFSSEGHNSIGGYDVFKSTWDGTKWSNPENLGLPINSPADDIYFSQATNKKFFLLSSYREGGYGMRDLFLAVPTEKLLANVTLIDSLTRSAIDSTVTLTLKSKKTTYQISENLSKGVFDKKINNHEVYEVLVYKGNKLIYSDSLVANEGLKNGLKISKTFTVPYHQKPPIIVAQKEEAIHEILKIKEDADTAIITKDYIFGNIFFEHNQSKITKKYVKTLSELIRTMKSNSEIVIEIQGFADEDGDAEYNKQLSDLRAHNVYDYIVSRGISRKRVLFKGYGQTNKFAKELPKTLDSEESKKQNRRAQFVKINK